MQEQAGYLWSFPRPDHLAVGICAPATAGTSSGDLLRQSRAWIGSHQLNGVTSLQQYAWPIPSVASRMSEGDRSSGPGWMLLGDAAGLVDPLTREGVYYALLSGLWAAEAIAGAGSRRPEDVYAGRLRDEMYPELSRAARVSRLFFSPRFSRLFVTAPRESGPM